MAVLGRWLSAIGTPSEACDNDIVELRGLKQDLAIRLGAAADPLYQPLFLLDPKLELAVEEQF